MSYIMRYILLCFFILIAKIAFAAQVIVLVDGKAITDLDVSKRIEAIKLISPDLTDSVAVRRQVLNNLVSEELFHHEAKRLKLTITEDEIKNHLKSLQQNLQLSDEKLKTIMNNKALKQQIESQLLWNKLITSVFYNKVKVSDAEVQEEQKIRSNEITQVTFKQILFREYDISKVEALKAETTDCQNLDDIAKEKGLSKPYTNTVQFIDLNPDLQSLTKILPENKLSDIIKFGDYKEVIMICSKVSTSSNQNIYQIRQELGERKIKAEAQKYLVELKKRIYVEYVTPIE